MSGLTIGFVRAAGLFGGLIGWFGGAEFSHYTTILPSDPSYVIDARNNSVAGVPAGVQKRPLSYLKHDRILWLNLAATAQQLAAVETALKSQLGKPYDQQGILNFATGQMHDRNWQDESAWFCSELGIWSLQQAGLCPQLALKPNRITPGDAALIVGALGAQATTVKI